MSDAFFVDVSINKNANVDPSMPEGSRVMRIFTIFGRMDTHCHVCALANKKDLMLKRSPIINPLLLIVKLFILTTCIFIK